MDNSVGLPVTVRHGTRRTHLNLGEVWRYRELIYFLAWRDVKVRYQQTVMGLVWTILQPLATMGVFTILFGRLAQLPSGEAPYALSTLAALVPWQYFAQSLNRASYSLTASQNLIQKVYFPRLVIPISAVLSGLVDFAISLAVLLVLLPFGGVPVTGRLLLLPLLVLLVIPTSLAVSLWLSTLNVRYRDVSQALPFLTNLWMYATPVAYSARFVPERWRALLGLNPMSGVVEAFRVVLFGRSDSPTALFAISGLVVLLLLVGGLNYFRREERSFADVI